MLQKLARYLGDEVIDTTGEREREKERKGSVGIAETTSPPIIHALGVHALWLCSNMSGCRSSLCSLRRIVPCMSRPVQMSTEAWRFHESCWSGKRRIRSRYDLIGQCWVRLSIFKAGMTSLTALPIFTHSSPLGSGWKLR